MGLLRSEDMQHATLILPAQDCKKFIVELGYDDDVHVQFQDMNAKDLRRPYKKYVDRIAEMERILRFMGDEFAKLEGLGPILRNEMEKFQQTEQATYSLDKLESELSSKYSQWLKFKDNDEKLTLGKNSTKEEACMVKHAERNVGSSRGGLEAPLLGESQLCTVGGVIEEKEVDKLHKALWRASRGNAFFVVDRQNTVQVTDPKAGTPITKAPFVAYYQHALDKRINNVCLAMGANLYTWPRSQREAAERQNQLKDDLEKNDKLLRDFKTFLEEEAKAFVEPDGENGEGNSKIENYRLFCRKEKSVYTILNLFRDGMALTCEVWFPKSETDALQEKLAGIKTESGQVGMMKLSKTDPPGIPPTYVQTNDFLEPWQGVINTYGIPSYKTANPVMITAVTFPFIFGMMYGDIGHGSMLFCAGLFLMWRGSQPGAKYDFPLYSIRFVIAQMGFFAIFAGLMYNDLFGMVGLELFDSRFEKDGQMVANFNSENLADCGEKCLGPYPFGLDPGWHGASNELLFQNSLKMKLSVLIGVLQMLLGVFLRFSNAIHDASSVDLLCECIPMLIFMVCFFGYMDYMIIYKWTHKIPGDVAGPDGPSGTNLAWGVDEDDNPGSAGAPGIINSLICMAMHQTDKAPLFPGAQDLASTLMLFAVISVPWLLIPKPLILKSQHSKADDKAKSGAGGGMFVAFFISWVVIPYILNTEVQSWASEMTYYAVITAVTVIYMCQPSAATEEEDDQEAPVVEAEQGGGHGHGHGEHFEFGEVLIHQVIETIEYVLGTVSHTASYLRIWALSLAHQQLSAVFYKYTLLMAFSQCGDNPIMSGVILYLAFGAWIGVTIGVLLMMDVLECFLHTLRLHWVEFQSKFYRGDGQWFADYNIKALLMDE